MQGLGSLNGAADYQDRILAGDGAHDVVAPEPACQTQSLRARPVETQGSKVIVEGELIAHGEVCATCRGTFVAVKPGHPAYHRWE